MTLTRRPTNSPSTQKSPRAFRPETREWFDSVVAQYVLESHHVRLLTLAALAWDRCAEARERLDAEGLTISGREGIKAHPCVAIERDSRTSFAAIVKQLKLDEVGEPQRGVGRPHSGFGITREQLDGWPEHRLGRRPRRREYENGSDE